VVTSIDNTAVRSVTDWNRRLGTLEPGEVVMVHLLAGGRDISVFLRVPEE
jgi:S1-C subfamily serine protease